MKFLILLLPFLLLSSCKKNNENRECFDKFGIENCSELFDSIQGSIDQTKILDMRECYEKQCQ